MVLIRITIILAIIGLILFLLGKKYDKKRIYSSVDSLSTLL